MALVSLRGLTCRYPQRAEPALSGIDLDLEAGEILLVLGASESGKSTLCRFLCGFFTHFHKGSCEGEAEVCGLDPGQAPLVEVIQRAGMVFQRPETQITGARFSVRGEVACGPENLGLERPEILERTEEALALTGLAALADKNPFALSGGEKQRLALASILAMRPSLLVLDEAASQLDPQAERDLLEVARRLAEKGTALVMTACLPGRAAAMCHKLLVLDRGRPILYGTPREVLSAASGKSLHAAGTARPACAQAAVDGAALGLWPDNAPLPLTVAEAAEGFLAGGRHAL